ncbi:DUF2461 domain-containing protein [Aquimarina sp. ERC-38]|uniref:DUF2461 domain-containing protein n=1 Tax=Aquimarina sp. ERC-38 TaxID=2949996 RepID=UPI0022460E5E|nr:DUF2461 domain-containing protein [Aquimarina sp. ERC-38]UZO80216.1 DUF2461 domain-containing protein [Aquimarina sp. ERC-38]
MTSVALSNLEFLKDLKENNTREWMQLYKPRYQENEKIFKTLCQQVEEALNKSDTIEKLKIFRINRDVRFSKNKTPYNVHRSASFSRAGAQLRGGYYLRIEPGNSLMGGGFFNPEPADLLRIRKEFEMDDQEIRAILNDKKFKKAFGGFNTEHEVKTAPKGFSKEHPAIDLIRKKAFFVTKSYTDEEVTNADFLDQLISDYQLLRPFFDYMSDVLTTDLNGESLL